jgi:Fe-S cluster biogenesis protein NfuA/nitrite reductase/ring-hydroxylating ferredoxin subunit
MDLHGAALARMVEMAAAGSASLIDSFAGDDLVASVLLLHGLHPLGLAARIERALDRARPYLHSHRGEVRLISAEDGVVRLRLEGNCRDCPWSSRTVALLLEEVICATAPDVESLQVQGQVALPLSGRTALPLLGAAADRGGWVEVTDLPALAEDEVHVRRLGDADVLFCRVQQALYAYEASCGACGSPLGEGPIRQGAIVCPSCGAGFDLVGAGRGLSDPNRWLGPLPLLFEQGRVRVALPWQ